MLLDLEISGFSCTWPRSVEVSSVRGLAGGESVQRPSRATECKGAKLIFLNLKKIYSSFKNYY